MTIEWSYFLPGLILLLFPADGLLSKKVELRGMESFRSLHDSPRRRPWWWVPVLWIDPVRGFVGGRLLIWSCDFGAGDWSVVPKPAYGVLVALLSLAVIV